MTGCGCDEVTGCGCDEVTGCGCDEVTEYLIRFDERPNFICCIVCFPVQPHEATEMVAEAEIYLQNGT